jgi:hypothetical protein
MTEQEIKTIAAKLQAEHDELEPYFNQVCNKTDWKAPIDAFCRIEDYLKIKKAIAFFTATDASFSKMCPPSDECVRVQSIGYRAGPAGDH